MQLVFMISRGRALRGSAHHITQMMLAAVAFSKGRELKARGAAWRGWLPGNLEIAWIAHLSLLVATVQYIPWVGWLISSL